MLTIYHNPRCRKSREALQYLQTQELSIEIVRYLDTPFQKDELKKVLNKIGIRPSEVVRKNEAQWKALENRNELNEEEIFEVLIQYPKLIERPLVTDSQSGVLARPLEKLKLFLESR
jgi:arsenate reductase